LREGERGRELRRCTGGHVDDDLLAGGVVDLDGPVHPRSGQTGLLVPRGDGGRDVVRRGDHDDESPASGRIGRKERDGDLVRRAVSVDVGPHHGPAAPYPLHSLLFTGALGDVRGRGPRSVR
jgi:hypothetical protein